MKISFRLFIFIALSFLLSFGARNSYASSFETNVKDLILEKLSDDIVDVELKFNSQSKLSEIKLATERIKNIQMVNFNPNYSNFRIEIMLDDESALEIGGRYIAYVDLPITSRAIKVGTIITASDLSSVRIPISRSNSSYVSSMSDIIGMQTKRNIAVGTLIRNSDLSKPTLIRQNDSISIVYSNDNIKLRTSGVALESGAIGDYIKVRNENTGIVVHGVVKGKNLVEVGD
ncbi:MAG: hypothetical protein RLZZ59_348 [Pseudomonadota bacterium]|jgi:flagella basal body P-ring formation protein FlgA